MLWVKESNKKSALYVDAFSLKSHFILDQVYCLTRNGVENTLCEKSDEISLEKRKDGNRSFGRKDYLSAWGMYNDSLCYAEQGSENISLAYANRSACFFHRKKYEECLIDIELAQKAGYPAQLMHKLNQREADCLKLIEEGAQEPDNRLKLSYEPDEHFPCMANVLKIEKNAKNNLIMVAKDDIEVGKIIAAEKSFVTCLYTKFGWRCCICLKDGGNLIPCKRCNFAMFCSKECEGSLIHEYECGLRYSKSTQLNGVIMNELRTLFKVIEMFPNVDELMTFVEQVVQSDQKEIPDTLTDERSKYRAFLKLPIYKNAVGTDDFWMITYSAYRMLMDIPKINAMFKAKKHNRFLMHLIMQHSLVSSKNSIRVRLLSLEPVPTDRHDVCIHAGLIKRYFKHACAPNVLWVDRNGYSVYITIRPVKKGEQLFITVFDLLMEPKEKRQKILLENMNFLCECTLCTGPSATREQRKQLLSDPLYKAGLDSTEKCAAILQKYGHEPLCNEMKNVLNVYCELIRFQYIGPMNIRAWAEIISDSLSNK